MEEELQEADISRPEQESSNGMASIDNELERHLNLDGLKKSKPVLIPAVRGCADRSSEQEFECRGYDDESMKVMPPHLIVARRMNDRMVFSVFTGNGRTLKGRDLVFVRNSVLRMTGFLEGEVHARRPARSVQIQMPHVGNSVRLSR